MVEDEMARQLRARGVNTVLSYVEFQGKQPSEDEVMSQLNKIGMNAVLVAKFIKREYKSIGNPDNPYSPPDIQPYGIIEPVCTMYKPKKDLVHRVRDLDYRHGQSLADFRDLPYYLNIILSSPCFSLRWCYNRTIRSLHAKIEVPGQQGNPTIRSYQLGAYTYCHY